MPKYDSKSRLRRTQWEISARYMEYVLDKYYQEKNDRTPNPDTVLRYQIHEIIRDSLNLGESKIMIMQHLCNQFPDCKWTKFFSTWIDDQIAKREKRLVQKEPDGMDDR